MKEKKNLEGKEAKGGAPQSCTDLTMVLSSTPTGFSLSLALFFLSTRSFRAFTDYKRWHNSLSHVALNETHPTRTSREKIWQSDHHRPPSPTQPIGSPPFLSFQDYPLFLVVVNVFASSPSKSSKAFFLLSFLTTPGPVDLLDMDSSFVLFSLFGEREESPVFLRLRLSHTFKQTTPTECPSITTLIFFFSFWLWGESKAKGIMKRFFLLNTHVTYFLMLLLLFKMEGDHQNSGDQQQ